MRTNETEGEKPTDTAEQPATTALPDGVSWDDIAHVTASTYRTAAVDGLAERPQTPSALAERSEHDIAHISRALQTLRDRGLVALLVPEERRKGRIYGLTETGQATVRALATSAIAPVEGGQA